MKKPIGLALSVPVILILALPAVAQRYSIIDLGTVQDNYSESGGVNNLGHVAGCADTESDCNNNVTSTGFLWSQSEGLQTLPMLPSGQAAFAAAINDSDEVTGNAWVGPYSHAVLWRSDKTIQDLGTLPRGSNSVGHAINNRGQVTGYSYGDFASYHAFLWTSGAGMRDIGPPGPATGIGYGVNLLGHVCGEFINREGTYIGAFLWTEEGGMQNLGTLPGWTWSSASGLNDMDQIVGSSAKIVTGGYIGHATLWSKRTNVSGMKDLGTLPGGFSSFATAINNLGQIVGSSGLQQESGVIYRAFVWSTRAGMQDLNLLIPPESAWTLLYASGINDLGQITGYGTIDQQTHAFLLTPSH